jgi:hypothetical protein
VAWENGFQHSGSRWFADTEEVTLTEPGDPPSGHRSAVRNRTFLRHLPLPRRQGC